MFVEDWAATYGSPYLVKGGDDNAPQGRLVEDGAELRPHAPASGEALNRPLAFVDGVRRGEAALSDVDPETGAIVRAVAGAHACGVVVGEPGSPLCFGEIQASRMLIWGSGIHRELPDVPGGWSWAARSIDGDEPDAPLQELQRRMREAEGRLAEDEASRGRLVVVDGPLNFVRSRDLPVVGYIKTHHRPLLPPEQHRRIAGLAPTERTSIFSLGSDRYSCYLRLTPSTRLSGPWSGIVRLEVPQSAGLRVAIETLDNVAGMIPRYAGVAHRDPRAPQNLQPVGGLERELRHRLGDLGLAYRAVRTAVSLSLEGSAA
ncbi:MAG: hypothetical protein ACREQM_16085 [Candidatus Dormibacteraceae bacterium]